MIISGRLRSIRETKNISQGEIEKRTGLKRAYISRVENGHTVPSIGTLKKWAAALGLSLYEFFYEGEEPPEPPLLPRNSQSGDDCWGNEGDSLRYLLRLRQLLPRISEYDRQLLLSLVFRMVRRKKS